MFDFTLTNNFQYQESVLAHASYQLTYIFVDQGQFSDPAFISGTHEREKDQFVLTLTLN